MKQTIRYGFTLGLICIIASGLLAGVYSLTKAKIAAQAQSEEQGSLQDIMPKAANFETVKKGNNVLYYKATDKDNKFIGVVFKAYGDGYSSDIETMVGMLSDGTVTAIQILNQNETPGLGTRVAEPDFTNQFKNKNIESINDVQTITGATISSTAVIDSVREKAAKIKVLIKDEK